LTPKGRRRPCQARRPAPPRNRPWICPSSRGSGSTPRGSSFGAHRAEESPTKSVCAPRPGRHGREPGARARRPDRYRGHDLALGQMPMANQPLLAFLCQKAGMPAKEIRNLGLDGIGQKLPRTTAQNFTQWILKCTWLGELNDIILGHGVSSFNGKWSFEHPTICRLTSLPRHQLLAIAPAVGIRSNQSQPRLNGN
jgi:hypothetical protein